MNAQRGTNAQSGMNARATGPAVRCAGLSKVYGRVRALDRLDLEIHDGEILALLGPSGCGKTTTLRLIAGLARPDEGTVSIEDRVVADAATGRFVAPERRRVGMVFQDFALFPHLNAAQNVAFGLTGIKDRSARAAHVMRMLSQVGLGGLGGRLPHELSGGQQQRVALARALAPGPAVLLLDEPFSNLDARMRYVVREEVRDVLKATGTTALFVTHDQAEALFMGDRVAVLNGGRLEQVDVPEAVYERPATHFVADFLDQARFVTGTIVEDGAAVETALGRLAQSYDLPSGTAVQVLVRPDDVRLDELPATDVQPNGHKAIVERRFFQGMTNLYRVRLHDGHVIKVQTPHERRLATGEAVVARFAASHPIPCYYAGQVLQQRAV